MAQSSAPFLPEASEPPRVVRPEPSTRALEPPAEDRRDEVVLRQKPPTGRKVQLPPARQTHRGFGDESSEPETGGRGERPGRKVAPLTTTEDSLASIPFIGERWCRGLSGATWLSVPCCTPPTCHRGKNSGLGVDGINLFLCPSIHPFFSSSLLSLFIHSCLSFFFPFFHQPFLSPFFPSFYLFFVSFLLCSFHLSSSLSSI